ncbi:RES family NAD+ phosphorylase [Shewanella sedimentimangrovi]|uniref:RES family NAD+ phosphorylase n=1 Tax=Shewanella sedimentimangrovi TaxID=2814293 RepID=A0ABX7QY97_9GAMM|nr:RES family NAD+ phosphorylase [Shewanella sedimentimangrovi]QSX35588.1 RES family NAD+ phosphorylase [Shewanella sedimentimangrovi]
MSIKLESLSAGTELKRVHASAFGPTTFNPGFGWSRFSPVSDALHEVPTMYAAQSTQGALMETAFHDVAHTPGPKSYDANNLNGLMLSTVRINTDLTLAKCYGPALRALGITEGELVHSDASQYDETREWSKAIHADPAKVDGLIWRSKQGDGHAFMLFGDRVQESDLGIVNSEILVESEEGVNAINELADEMNLVLHKNPLFED